MKSTDDAMIDTLVKMSGTKHESRSDQKTVEKDNERLINKTSGRVTYTIATKERPVIDFNDFMFIQERNSIVIKAGSSPLWNKNETAYPMSWKLFGNTISLPGKKYSLQTIPTNSSAKDFDVRKNQPSFFEMLDLRLAQAKESDAMHEAYRNLYGLTETDMLRLDQNVVADDIMHAINSKISNVSIEDRTGQMSDEEANANHDEFGISIPTSFDSESVSEPNIELKVSADALDMDKADSDKKRYAKGSLCRGDLVGFGGGAVNRHYDRLLADAYAECVNSFEDGVNYRTTDENELKSCDGVLYVKSGKGANKSDVDLLTNAEADESKRVFSEVDVADADGVESFYEVTDEFIKHLASLDSWAGLAGGRFEIETANLYRKME